MEEYNEAAVEVLDILNNASEYDIKQIPKSFINFLENISSKTYKVNFDHTKSISELNIKHQTKEILGFMYINWWSSKEEREEYKKVIKKF